MWFSISIVKLISISSRIITIVLLNPFNGSPIPASQFHLDGITNFPVDVLKYLFKNHLFSSFIPSSQLLKI